MEDSEIEKQNFILWYGLYATETEIEKARSNNGVELERLIKKYAKEIEQIEKSRSLHKQVFESNDEQISGI